VVLRKTRLLKNRKKNILIPRQVFVYGFQNFLIFLSESKRMLISL